MRAETESDFAGPAMWTVALATLAVHLAVAGRYDFFRNELYFIICGRHPDFGYVDQPSLVPLLAAATQMAGENLWLLRLPAALAAAALVPVTAAIARLLGGGARAAWMAGLASAIAPALIALTTTLGTPTLEPLGWTLCGYLVLRAAMREEPRMLIWAGAVAGLSLANKYGIAIWLVGLCLGMALSPARRLLATRHFRTGLVIAILIGAPSLVWQALHGWPFLAIVRHHSIEGRIFAGPLPQFLIGQALAMNIALAPLWIAGLIAPFFREELKPARILSIAALVTFAAIVLAHGKNYYLFPIYPSLFAIGAATLERFQEKWAPVFRPEPRPNIERLNRWLAGAWMALAFILSLIVFPVVLPIFSPGHLERFLARTHLAPRPEEAAAIGAPITQIFSDQFGWRALAGKVAEVWRALPPDQRAHAAILASNYGEAAAIDFYGHGLPPALSGQNQYYLWGPRGADGRAVILVNANPARWRGLCGSLLPMGRFGNRYAMPYEKDRPILLCRNLRPSLATLWPRLMRFQ